MREWIDMRSRHRFCTPEISTREDPKTPAKIGPDMPRSFVVVVFIFCRWSCTWPPQSILFSLSFHVHFTCIDVVLISRTSKASSDVLHLESSFLFFSFIIALLITTSLLPYLPPKQSRGRTRFSFSIHLLMMELHRTLEDASFMDHVKHHQAFFESLYTNSASSSDACDPHHHWNIVLKVVKWEEVHCFPFMSWVMSINFIFVSLFYQSLYPSSMDSFILRM